MEDSHDAKADETLERLRKALRFDRDGLDTAIERQPVLFDNVSKYMVGWTAARDQTKRRLELHDAEISARFRRKAKERLTEKSLSESVERDPVHQELVGELLKAKFYVESFMALQDAYRQRGFMLREYASLYVAGYWQESSVRTGDAADVMNAAYRERRKLLRHKGR